MDFSEYISFLTRELNTLKAENERLQNLIKSTIQYLNEDGSTGCTIVEGWLKRQLEKNDDT